MKTKLPIIALLLCMFVISRAQQPSAYTMGHDPLGAHNFNFYGALNTQGISASYHFVFSTDSTFATSQTSPAKSTTSNKLAVVWATVNSLSANTTYYYYLTATSNQGTSNGKHMSFYSDTVAFDFENTGGDVYGSGYAEINGRAANLTGTHNISFEYGLTPDLGLTATSNQATISDGNTYYFRGVPSPVSADSLYFFRAKAVSATDSFYSDIRGFYMGTPYQIVQALPATNVTTTSADLNGEVQGFPVPVKINSEINGPGVSHLHTQLVYHDTTPNLIPYVYNATNLQGGQYYTARFKVDTWVGNFYGDTAFSTLPVGINEIADQANSFTAYPNPASNLINVQLTATLNAEATLEMFDLSGQKVKEIKLTQGALNATVNTGNLESGLYILRLTSNNILCNTRIAVTK